MKNILSLTAKEAKEYFLSEECYFTSKLPPYFEFGDLLQKISKNLEGKKLSDVYSSIKKNRPDYLENVNYKLITNKDGKYAWRPLQLIHPVIYVSLVHEITGNGIWQFIVNRFNELIKKSRNRNIECVSIPVIPNDHYKKNTEAQIHNWLEEVEKPSIINSLEYDYLYHTDIVDCYSAIYTHSIAWALHGKDVAKKERRNNELIGNIIDKQIQAMSYGQTNGIPQGSGLMDFIAEMVLCYIDSLLSDKVKNYKKKDYKIIRYRDDYRIFVNNPQIGDHVIKVLTEIIHDFGMKINSAKTIRSDHITHDSMKEDKLYWMTTKNNADKLKDELYTISSIAKQFPNSGTLQILLHNFHKKIRELSKKDIKTDILVLISVVVDIAYKNPRMYPETSAILSKLIDFLPKNEKRQIIRKILNKFKKIANTGIMQLWLQRITIPLNSALKSEYTEKLCKKVTDNNIVIWNSNWLNEKFRDDINSCGLVNKERLEKLGVIIGSEEFEVFSYS